MTPDSHLHNLLVAETPQVEKNFRAGEIIMRQGEPGEIAYFIQQGQVQVLVRLADGSEVEVARRSAGSLIGEMAIVDGGPRSASIIALQDCCLLEISRSEFSKALTHANPIVGLVTRLILMRYRNILQRSASLGELDPASVALEREEHAHAEQSKVLDAVRLSNEFRVALADSQLFLEYQPFVELSSGTVIGFEALLRWNHPVHGRMPPDQFIPLIEETGQIIAATRWVFREACGALLRMQQAAGNNDLFMSINFSAQDFDEPEFVTSLCNVAEQEGIEPRNIHLEITERLLLRQASHVSETLKLCRDKGMEVSIDDFGTGYSSLSYLHRYPISTLKIDKSFISNMSSDDGALGLVRSIMSISDNLGLSIIAEGVENDQQVSMLRSLRCHVAQGFYFSRPLAESDAISLLNGVHIDA
ncbi:EAL domain-containing protein [Pseudohongiella spirulinae]|uniref:Cyclic nucleotide-binding domain protein n=1 Tax=Pseudohongiella spirulinae TaxID=1249552 RepID=A0A0S2KD69_9GAMM|nr:EAL domain-containing protein [Pseudohongiella spirulinae]ALO46266.1 Cyclic nucleotide-binding domain protein [Pseudohongiella spirulinae]